MYSCIGSHGIDVYSDIEGDIRQGEVLFNVSNCDSIPKHILMLLKSTLISDKKKAKIAKAVVLYCFACRLLENKIITPSDEVTVVAVWYSQRMKDVFATEKVDIELFRCKDEDAVQLQKAFMFDCYPDEYIEAQRFKQRSSLCVAMLNSFLA